MQQKWLVLVAVSLIFFFLNGATFASLGVVLFSMIKDLHWSQTAAGASFSLLGIACGVASPLPALLMKRMGTGRVVVLGGACLAAGFWLAFLASGLPLFYLAVIFLGLGYALAGNIPGVYLLASWFPHSSSRVIGFYLMLGAAGNVVGPPLVAAVVAASHSWRFNWLLMGIVAVLITVVCLLFIRDAPRIPDSAPAPGAAAAASHRWGDRDAMMTRQFVLVAASMTLTVAGITTNSSVAVTHLVQLGTTPVFAAFILSLVALIAMLAKGAAGTLAEKVRPSRLLAAGLALQCLGDLAFIGGASAVCDYLFAAAFGVGWGLSYVSANLVLLEYFGREVGARILSAVWMLSTLAAAGPFAAGVIADHFGTFNPIFLAYALLLGILAVPIFLMRAPET
ncbi:MAG TPA: MFS transporter [Steroidobacteraceae bacterium]|jgi:MFS family permease